MRLRIVAASASPRPARRRGSLWVSFAADTGGSGCADGDALVEGIFNAGARGHRGMWSGTIEEIDRCMRWR